VKFLNPQGVIVVVEAQHLCMKMRGIKAQGNTTMRTNIATGKFLESTALRNEFMFSLKK
jgi:GTP cyclohydrolase I